MASIWPPYIVYWLVSPHQFVQGSADDPDSHLVKTLTVTGRMAPDAFAEATRTSFAVFLPSNVISVKNYIMLGVYFSMINPENR